MYTIHFKNGEKLRINEWEFKHLTGSEVVSKLINFLQGEKKFLTINIENINFIIDEKLESERVVKEFPTTFAPTTVPNHTGTQWGAEMCKVPNIISKTDK